jgi:spore germination protein
LELRLTGNVVEYTGSANFENEAEVKVVEKAVSHEIEPQANELIERFKDMGIDPLSIGESIRKRHRGEWSKERWIEAMKRADIHVHVTTNIIGSGTVR